MHRPEELAAMPLEERMRPGVMSQVGFLGEEESLEEVLALDAATLDELGVTTWAIADRMEALLLDALKRWDQRGEQASENEGAGDRRVRLDDRFEVTWEGPFDGWQDCPFEPEAASPRYDTYEVTVRNFDLDETFEFPGLGIHLIRGHGFFEGRESPWRMDPEQAVRVLEIPEVGWVDRLLYPIRRLGRAGRRAGRVAAELWADLRR